MLSMVRTELFARILIQLLFYRKDTLLNTHRQAVVRRIICQRVVQVRVEKQAAV